MKIYKKDVTVGEYSFSLAIDRDITADAFERYPDLMEFLLSQSAGENNSNAVVIKAIKDKNVRMLLDSTEQIKSLVKYAFPRMLKKADVLCGTENEKISERIWTYLEDNEVDDEFATSVFEFICSGFTPETAEKKPKVKLTIK